MANCLKCCGPTRRNKTRGYHVCKRCGVQPSGKSLNRCGVPMTLESIKTSMNEAEQTIKSWPRYQREAMASYYKDFNN